MEFFNEIWLWLLAQGGIPGVVAIGVLLAAFGVQLWYYLRVYGRIASPRTVSDPDGGPAGGVSVIIPLRGPDYPFLEDTLPLLLSQEEVRFGIVLMDMADDADFSFALTMAAEREPRIHIIRLTGAPVKKMSDKMALNVGIKGAKYENLVFTKPECRPVSGNWLAAMADGFRHGSVVIGYCGLERGSAGGGWGRLERMAWSVRWLGRALRGKPYRGTICNMGFTKEAYYANDGFNRLNLNIGEDDLFIQKLAERGKVAVMAEGEASVRQSLWQNWYKEKKLASATFRFYPMAVKLYIGAELWSRALFFGTAGWLTATMPPEIAAAAGVFLAARLTIVWIGMYRAGRRLGERGLMWFFPAFDLLTPALEAWLALGRSLRKPEGLWR